MKMLATAILAVALLCSHAFAEAPEVRLVQEPHSLKVLIGPDVFTSYHYGPDRRKPFFLPVTGPGGFELLQQAVADAKADSVSRKVVIASATAPLHTAGDETTPLPFGQVLEISRIDGDRLWSAEPAGWVARADIAPLAAVVTRLINDDPAPSNDKLFGEKYDHPHHKGIWFSVDEIDDIKFWMEASLIQTQQVKILEEGARGKFSVVNHWLNKDGEPILKETTTVTISPDRLLVYDTSLTPAGNEVHIGDTKEGMFAIRLAGPMREQGGGGPVTNAEGLQGSVQAWGKPSRWVNYDGRVDGHVFGVTLMDDSQNPWKSRYHVRDYGLFAVNPFGAESYTANSDDPQPRHSRQLKPGESLNFKFAAWIHGAEVTPEQIEQAYLKL